MTNPAPPFAWLHLTDLHQGMWSQDWLWPQLRETFFEDLERLHDRCGPWQVVFFTGDLTQTGTSEEFAALERESLTDLENHLRKLGSQPKFIAVPGNHDLVRPRQLRAVHRVLVDWSANTAAQADLYQNPDSEYHEALREIFGPYSNWWAERRAQLPSDWIVHQGLLPGDFSLTIPHHNRQIGVIGLNSSFAQLTNDDFNGKLHLDTRQFHGACRHLGDGPNWAKQHDLCFLLSHHPSAWLSPAARAQLRAEIDVPGRFVAHLYGHMHTASQYSVSEGGAEQRRYWQGSSLFGLEFFGDRVDRAHGYTAGRIEFSDDHAKLRLWPRIAVKLQAGPWHLAPDHTVRLEDDGGTRAELLPLAPLSPAPTAGSTPTVDLQGPGLPYDSAWHVTSDDEGEALKRLERGEPLAVCGPLHFGKSWFLQRLREHFAEQDGVYAIASIDFNLVEKSSLETILQGLADQLAEAVGIKDELPWPTRGAQTQRFVRVLCKHVAPRAERIVVLVIDLPDDMWTFPQLDDFFGVLRVIAGQSDPKPWKWLRIVLGFSMAPALFIARPTQSPWNLMELQLREFSRSEIEGLMRRNGLRLEGDQLDALMAQVGGHPYMIRAALYAATHEGASIDEILRTKLGFHLKRLEALLVRDPELCRSLCRAVAAQPIDHKHGLRLEAAGLLRWSEADKRYTLRFAIYQRLLDKLCTLHGH